MTGLRWLARSMVEAAHQQLVAQYGGSPGVRDDGLLDSALARPRNLAAYGEPTLAELAAAYAFGIARNHPFVDGNKRAALAAVDMFLQFNGQELEPVEAEAVIVFRDLAAGDLDEAALARWIGANIVPRRD